MADPMRGEIWSADMGTGRGREQSGQRPVLILSVDGFKRGPAELLMAIPLTSKVAKSRAIPLHVPVSPPEGGLRAPSVILCDQLRAVSKDGLGKTPWGTVSTMALTEVEKAVRVPLGL